MGLKFGTDGIRGRAGAELTVEDIETLGSAAGATLGGAAMVVGSDTRESGPDFVAALCRGLGSRGIDAWVLGDVPTPAVAHVAAHHGVSGAMVSASHNPYYDNGVKFFAPGGRKLTDVQQASLEAELAGASRPVATGTSGGAAIARTDLVADYVASAQASISGRTLEGLKVVVDCANGAASAVAPGALARLGAEVVAIHDRPNGRNINDGAGSTDMSALQAAVLTNSADVGVAFDGDADRMLGVDRHGVAVDGDQLIAMCAIDMLARDMLKREVVVVTVMTNLGFHHSMKRRGIEVHQTQVGDRHVLDALETNGWSLGGEQSGHVIFRDLATTGDGLLTAIQLLDVMARTDADLHELASEAMVRLPQRLRNVEIAGDPVEAMTAMASEIELVERSLGESGRLLVRPSGTEALIRVMAEAPTQEEADAAVDRLVRVLEGLQ